MPVSVVLVAGRGQGADKRTQEMDLWSAEEVIAWFVEEGFPEYEPTLVKHRVDGFLVGGEMKQPGPYGRWRIC